MMKPDYRFTARQSLARARQELDAQDPHRLYYAAFELRVSLEYVTYDRAFAYRKEIPPSEYDTWQPRKLMKILLEIDPWVDKSASLSIAPEASPGVVAPGTKFKSLGTDYVVGLTTLKKHYDALGSYLHAPTIKLIENPKPDKEEKLRVRCEAVYLDIERALSSPVFNLTIGNFAEMDCMRCKHPIKRRIPLKTEVIEARCFKCDATYVLTPKAEHSVSWKAKQTPVRCSNTECKQELLLWEDQIKVGTWWKCDSCKQRSQIVLGVNPVLD